MPAARTASSCICGVCTRACSVAREWAALAFGAECVAVAERPAEAACDAAESAAFCDISCSGDADCEPLGAPFRCQGGFRRAPGDGETATACPATTLSPGDNEPHGDGRGTTRATSFASCKPRARAPCRWCSISIRWAGALEEAEASGIP